MLVFVLIHKMGDTLANLTLRLLFDDLGFSNDEIAFYDVGVGFAALLAGVFVGGAMYASMGMTRSVLVSLILMAVSNFSFAALAAYGHSNVGMAGAIGFENFASGIGGVAVVAYLSALCNLRFTATQYALLSALASIAGRFLTGTTAGALIDALGYVNFYLLTTLIAAPGVLLYWYMIRSGLADVSIGSAGQEESIVTETRLQSCVVDFALDAAGPNSPPKKSPGFQAGRAVSWATCQPVRKLMRACAAPASKSNGCDMSSLGLW